MRRRSKVSASLLGWLVMITAFTPTEIAAVDPAKGDFSPEESVSVAATQSIQSPGPLTTIAISDDLNCAVNYVTDAFGEFYGDTACATLVAVDGILFGPASIPAGGSASPRTAFTAVSQSPVTGQGTASDPYTLVTTVDAGATGIRLEQTDTYVVGDESYRTSIAVENTAGSSKTVILYRAGDCYLQDDDYGLGDADPITGAVACVEGEQQSDGTYLPGTRRLEWLPITPDSRYMEGFYDDVWAWIGTQAPFPNTSRDTEYIDNGAGLSWEPTISAGDSAILEHITTFSPTLASSQVCAGEDLSEAVGPSATPGVRVEYDPRYIVDERRADYVAEAALIATTIRDRAQTTLARYDQLGFEVASQVTIRIKCSPAFYGIFHPGRRGLAQSDHEIELLSDYVRVEFAAEVVAYGNGGGWSPPLGGWTNLIDHEAFHTVQYRMGFPVQTAALGGDPVTLESTPGTAQDLVDIERDDSDLRLEFSSYLNAIQPLFGEPHAAIDQTDAEYASAAVFQYWGERFGPSTQPDLEQRVGSFLEVLLAAPDDRLTAMGRALDYDWATGAYRPITTLGPEQRALNALRDFYVAAYATSAQNAVDFDRYAIRDHLVNHVGGGSGSPYPAWELSGSAPIGPSGAVFSDIALARAQGGTWEFGVPQDAAEVLVEIATTEPGLVGQDAPLRVGVVLKNKNGLGPDDDVIAIDPALFRAGPVGGSVLPVAVPTAGYDTLAVAVIAGNRPVRFNLTAQVSSTVDLTIHEPTSQSQYVISSADQLVYALVAPTTDGQFQPGLTTRSFRMWIDGQETDVRFAPELEMLGRYALYGDLPAGIADGTHDLEVEWNGQHRTSVDSVVVDLSSSASLFAATQPNRFVNVLPAGEAGMPVLINIGLWSGETNVTEADVRATIAGPGGQVRTVQLQDLGMPADGGFEDGLYGALWWATTTSGTYSVTIDATGIDANGAAWSTTDSRDLTLAAAQDTDGDGIVDDAEIMLGLDPADPTDGAVDADGDGLSLAEEMALGADPWWWDTDGGGESDSSELAAGRDPTLPGDDATVPPARLALTPQDGRTVAIHVETESLTGSVRIQRRSGEQVVELGTFSGAGADLVDGPLVEGDYEYLAISLGPDGTEAPPKAYGPIHVANDVTPPLVRISVNAGNWVTADRVVSVALVDLSEPVVEMRVAASLEALESTAWTPYSNLATLELPALIGEHIVAAQVRDAAGHESGVALAPIFLQDSRPPESSVAPLDPRYTTPSIDIGYTASDDLSGVDDVELWWRYRASAADPWGDWAMGPAGASSPIPFTFDAGFGLYEFYSIAVDVAGNREDAPSAADAGTEYGETLDQSPVWGFGSAGSGRLGPEGSDCPSTGCPTPVQVTGLSDIIAVAAGTSSSVALSADGTVWTWGSDANGQLGDGPELVDSATPVQVSGLTDITAIASGGNHVAALAADRTVWRWGHLAQTTSVTPVPEQVNGLPPIVAVASGGNHTLAVDAGGTVWAWGYNSSGQLGNNKTTNSASPVQVSSLGNVVDIAAGSNHSLAIRNDGTAWAWGYNSFGQLGNGQTVDKKRPVQVSGLSSAVDITAGSYHSIALLSDGSLWSWGGNWAGQLGDGTTDQRNVPVMIPTPEPFAEVLGGGDHSMARDASGALYGWGRNTSGELGTGDFEGRSAPVATASSLTAVTLAAGTRHTLVIVSND